MSTHHSRTDPRTDSGKSPFIPRMIRNLSLPVILLWIGVVVVLSIAVPSLDQIGKERSVSLSPKDAPSVQAMELMGKLFKESDSDSVVMIVLEGDQPLGDSAHEYYNSIIRQLNADTEHVEHIQDFWGDPLTAAGSQSPDGKAAFNTAANAPQATAILQALHQMRFVDHSMSPNQQLAWGTLQQQIAANKLGMYIAAPDDIYNTIVPVDHGNVNDYGMGPLPSTSGTPAGSLSGGNGYMFAKSDTPAQIRAGIKWLNFEDLTPGLGQFNYARQKADGFPVGFPEPQLFTGATQQKNQKLLEASATIHTSYYSTFAAAHEKGMGEPPDAQALYAALNTPMLDALTEPNPDYSKLLSAAAGNVNTLLANSGG